MSLNIKIISASVREGRFGDKPAEWITTIAKEKEELSEKWGQPPFNFK